MKTITVEWKTSPVSGLTELTLSDVGCSSKTAWNKLSKEEQKQRISNALLETDISTITFAPTIWVLE